MNFEPLLQLYQVNNSFTPQTYFQEALLHQKCNNRRIAVAEGVNHRPPTFNRCIAPTDDGRCNKRVVPLSKYCMARILLQRDVAKM